MSRQPVVAGQFYPASASQLRVMIEKMVDNEAEKQDVIGLVSPHAGYVYSGSVAGAVISRVKFKDTFIILGPNHTGKGKPLSIMSQGTWQTPFGDVEIDAELAKHLLSITRHLQEDDAAHMFEHSIEVQLPFLQYFRPDIRIVPITLSVAGLDVYKEIGREMARAIKDTGREAVIMASSASIPTSPIGVCHVPSDMMLRGLPFPVWFGPRMMKVSLNLTLEMTAPATDPE